MERHVLKSVRVSSPQAPAVKTLVATAFAQDSNLMEDGCCGQDAFDHILRELCKGSNKASPAAVIDSAELSSLGGDTVFSVPGRVAVAGVERAVCGAGSARGR